MKKNKNISVLIVGLGSIGQRHLNNLKTLGVDDIRLLRSGKGTLDNPLLDEYPAFFNLEDALSESPDAVIVSNPSSMHLDIALAAAEKGAHLLIEKPVSHTLDKTDLLLEQVSQRKQVVLTGFQFRFHPAFHKIKFWLKEKLIGEVVSAQVHWGEYLPGWHPWEDFREGYSARKDLGGGALLTLCHPLDYLYDLLGEVDSVYGILDQRSNLGLDVEDMAQITLRFKNGAVGSVYLDYIERPPRHELNIIGNSGSITWSQNDGNAVLYSARRNQSVTYHLPKNFERNTLFLNEMKHFLACIEGCEKTRCSLTEGLYTLRVIDAVKRAAKNKHEVKIES